MKYLDFKNKIRNFPVFSSSQLSGFDEKEAVLRNQLSYWKKKGLVLEVKKGLYVLNEHDRKITPSIRPLYLSAYRHLLFRWVQRNKG